MLLRDLSETGDDCGHRRIVAEVAELLQKRKGFGEVEKKGALISNYLYYFGGFLIIIRV